MLNKYQWAVLGAALLFPSLLFAATRKTVKENLAISNLKAFLLMIQYAEGTYGADAYRMLFGGGLFSSFMQHPNQAITRYGITSTAAGAYQFLNSTWAALQQELELDDFSPASQDRAAIELIRRKSALQDVLNGKTASAIYKCRKVWASLPGAGYGQNERSVESLLRFYVTAGGQLTK